MYRYAELYMSRILVEDAAAMISSWKRREGEPAPTVIVCDWDAEGRATLERHLELETTAADKNVLEGFEDVKSRMKVQDDGKPRLFMMRDSLIDIDMELKDAGKPWCTEEEIDGYEWDDKKKKEQPRKEDDHGMDAMRYLCRHMALEMDDWSRGMKK
jgi:phage terminase large subunit